MMPKVDEKSNEDRIEEVEMALQVDWDSKVCIHFGNCVKTLPEVFRVSMASSRSIRRRPLKRG
jgi:uncharacterized Fe-S cluster protein YjdI